MNNDLEIYGSLNCSGDVRLLHSDSKTISNSNHLCLNSINGSLYINGNLCIIGNDVVCFSKQQDLDAPLKDVYIDGDVTLVYPKILVRDNVNVFVEMNQRFRRKRIDELINKIKNKKMAKFSKIIVLSKINALKKTNDSILQKLKSNKYGSWVDNTNDINDTKKIKMRVLQGLWDKQDLLVDEIMGFEIEQISTCELLVNALIDIQYRYTERMYFHRFIDKVKEKFDIK